MNTELDKIKLRITALARKTVENGCSEEEAMSAMHMVGHLLQSYNLTMDECDVRQSKCTTIHIPVRGTRRGPITSCMMNLAALFSGKCWFAKYGHRDRITHRTVSAHAFYIQEQDAEAVEYLFRVIEMSLTTEAQSFKKTDTYKDSTARKSAYTSFQRGMARRISTRLAEIKEANDVAMAAGKSTGTALIVLKGQLIEEEFKKENVKLVYRRTSERVRDPNAYAAGKAAGDRVNLNRPLAGNGKPSGFIGNA